MFKTEKVFAEATMKIEVEPRKVLKAITRDVNIVLEKFNANELTHLEAVIALAKMSGAYKAGVTALMASEGLTLREVDIHEAAHDEIEIELERIQNWIEESDTNDESVDLTVDEFRANMDNMFKEARTKRELLLKIKEKQLNELYQ